MKSNILIILILCSCGMIAAQSLDPSTEELNQKRLLRNQQGMLVLGGWAISQMAISGIALSANRQPTTEAFHQMNIGWNAVNLVIAGVGYYGALQGEVDLSLAESLQEHEKIKRILLVNAALDLGYMAGGFWMIERSKNLANQASRWNGFGRAVIMNGAFLLVFDGIMYALHQGDSGLFYDLVRHISLGPQTAGLTWRF